MNREKSLILYGTAIRYQIFGRYVYLDPSKVTIETVSNGKYKQKYYGKSPLEISKKSILKIAKEMKII